MSKQPTITRGEAKDACWAVDNNAHRSALLFAGYGEALGVLEELGYVETFNDPHSYVSMHLTDAGGELSQEMEADIEEAKIDTAEGMGDGEDVEPWREGDDKPLRRAPKSKSKKRYEWSTATASLAVLARVKGPLAPLGAGGEFTQDVQDDARALDAASAPPSEAHQRSTGGCVPGSLQDLPASLSPLRRFIGGFSNRLAQRSRRSSRRPLLKA